MPDVILPVNWSISFKVFITKNDFGVLRLPWPEAPIPYVHTDGTVWCKTQQHGATWPFEKVIKNLPEIRYEF